MHHLIVETPEISRLAVRSQVLLHPQKIRFAFMFDIKLADEPSQQQSLEQRRDMIRSSVERYKTRIIAGPILSPV